MEINLNGSQVNSCVYPGRDNCFELVSDSQKHLFQASNQDEMSRWLAILRVSREGSFESKVCYISSC